MENRTSVDQKRSPKMENQTFVDQKGNPEMENHNPVDQKRESADRPPATRTCFLGPAPLKEAVRQSRLEKRKSVDQNRSAKLENRISVIRKEDPQTENRNSVDQKPTPTFHMERFTWNIKLPRPDPAVADTNPL